MDLAALGEKRFAKLSQQYAQRKSLAESQVVEWHWATKKVWDINPLYFEINGERPGRNLASKPARLNDAFSYGTDAVGRIVVERDYAQGKPAERFFDWSKDPVEIAYFEKKKKCTNLQLAKYDGNKVIELATSDQGGPTIETYYWEGPQLARISIRVPSPDVEGTRCSRTVLLKKLADYQEVHVKYDSEGQVKRMEVHWLPRPPHVLKLDKETVFERRDKPVGLDLRKEAAVLRKMLEQGVEKYLKRHRESASRNGPLTRIDLIFSLGDSRSTPWVYLCLDCTADAGPGGDYTHPDFVKLSRKGWLPAVQTVCDGRKADVTDADGKPQKLGDSGLTRTMGTFLVSALLAARKDGVFAPLPLAKGCELGVEDPTTGAFGWPAYKDRGKDNLA